MDIEFEKTESNLSDNGVERIMEEYEKQLDFPRDKPEKIIMVCPIGRIGAGKTTVLKPLSKKLSLLRISNDEIRKILKENGYDYNRKTEIAYKLREKYLKQGYSIAVDADCGSPKSQEYIQILKDTYNLKVFWIHINPPEEFILNKLKTYKHTWLFKDAEEAIKTYERRKSLNKDLNLPFIYEFDTSKSNLEEQIEEAAKIIDLNRG